MRLQAFSSGSDTDILWNRNEHGPLPDTKALYLVVQMTIQNVTYDLEVPSNSCLTPDIQIFLAVKINVCIKFCMLTR